MSAILFRGGACLSACCDTPQADTPGKHTILPGSTPSRKHTSRNQTPPRKHTTSGSTPPGKHTPPGSTPFDGHCSGRYASYWTAFFFLTALQCSGWSRIPQMGWFFQNQPPGLGKTYYFSRFLPKTAWKKPGYVPGGPFGSAMKAFTPNGYKTAKIPRIGHTPYRMHIKVVKKRQIKSIQNNFRKTQLMIFFGLSFDMMNCLCLCWHLSNVNNDITTTGALFPWRHSHRDYAPSNVSPDVTFKVVILNVSLTHTVHSGKARGELRGSVCTNGLAVWKRKRQTVLHPAGTSIVSDICDLSKISDIAPLTLGSMEKSFFYHLFCVTQESYFSKD